MKSHSSTLLFTISLGLSLALIPNLAHATDLDDLDENGWGQAGVSRLALSAYRLSGTRPAAPVAPDLNQPVMPAPGAPTPSPTEDYSRTQAWLTYDLYGYFDKTRFNTLVGAELSAGLGFFTPEAADPERATEPSKDYSKIHARLDMAMDYAPIHWGGSLGGRWVFGAGFGGELGSSWYTDGARVYPLLLTRLQFFLGESSALHFAGHWLPSTSDANDVSELRLEGSYAIGSVDLGASLQRPVVGGIPQGKLSATAMGLVLGYIF
ncbi:MAG: hypothetical protein SFV15_26825 [Polyangiaceae bacterium]|nr:hypothetical protein [Polyangiaceae bacterium]